MTSMLLGCAGVGSSKLGDKPYESPTLALTSGSILTDNDDAFEAKLKLIEGAKTQLRLAYYIYGDDYSSAVLSKALTRAARRGVDVRVLLDYQTNYGRLDYYSMLEREGAGGSGRLQFRFYNRPSAQIIKDAVFLTSPCPSATKPKINCGEWKQTRIDKLFASLTPDEARNFNSGPSGLFLSGLYGREFDVAATAMISGQKIDLDFLAQGDGMSEADFEALIDFAEIYWKARHSNPNKVRKLTAQLKLKFAFFLHGEELVGLTDALAAHLPIGQQVRSEDSYRDWLHITDFLHHKLLLADEKAMVLGGRNIEDAYHMRGNRLLKSYVFSDTDALLALGAGGDRVAQSFDRLWDYREMVAGIDEVRAHAPNDILMTEGGIKAACSGLTGDRLAHCTTQGSRNPKTFAARLQQQKHKLQTRSEVFKSSYRPNGKLERASQLSIESPAEAVYLENLPIIRNFGDGTPRRNYGVKIGEAGRVGKAIHESWYQTLKGVCGANSNPGKTEVIQHNAYFLPPAELSQIFAEMVDGSLNCGHIRVRILTNSYSSTDLAIINLAARYWQKAFFEFYARHRHPTRGAEFRLFEYAPTEAAEREANLSLHSKVMIFANDIYVGSANADPRSLMLDSNNGVFLLDAGGLAEAYRVRFDALINDPKRVKEISFDLQDIPLTDMLRQDRDRLVAAAAKLVDAEAADLELPDEVKLMIQRAAGLLDRIYQDVSAGLRDRRPNGPLSTYDLYLRLL